jgi:hypothetical protein
VNNLMCDEVAFGLFAWGGDIRKCGGSPPIGSTADEMVNLGGNIWG